MKADDILQQLRPLVDSTNLDDLLKAKRVMLDAMPALVPEEQEILEAAISALMGDIAAMIPPPKSGFKKVDDGLATLHPNGTWTNAEGLE